MAAPSIVYADGDEASGMATMLGGLLEENLRDYPGRARVAGLARGDVVLTASDRDVSVTVSFRGDEVVVANGPAEGAAALAGPWLEMAKLCSGQVNPVKALARRELTIQPRGGRLDAVAAAGYVLSVPAIFYAQGDPEALAALGRRRRRTAVTVALVVGAGVAVVVLTRRGRRRSGRSPRA
ncbi:MAG: hypothetical protein U0V73_10860 [Acidimicrobiia bacterium]